MNSLWWGVSIFLELYEMTHIILKHLSLQQLREKINISICVVGSPTQHYYKVKPQIVPLHQVSKQTAKAVISTQTEHF